MADVRTRIAGGQSAGNSGGDRGQILLVAGLAIAVTLVALVLLLNTVIYTQNLATRGPQVEDGEAVAFRSEVVTGVGRVVDAENRAGHVEWSEVDTNVTAAIALYDDLQSRYAAERGIVTDVEEETVSFTRGVLLWQTNASRTFAAAGNDEPVDWTLVENASEVRKFRMTVSGENLSEGPSGAFGVQLNDSAGTKWQVYVYNDTASDDIAVAVKNGTEASATEVCRVSDLHATVDLTAGTVNGLPCPELVWAKGVAAPYNVTFRNGGRATGTYAVTVDTSPSETAVPDANFAEPTDEESPRAVPAVYAVAVDIHFETPTLAFHTRVRIAPGEPR